MSTCARRERDCLSRALGPDYPICSAMLPMACALEVCSHMDHLLMVQTFPITVNTSSAGHLCQSWGTYGVIVASSFDFQERLSSNVLLYPLSPYGMMLDVTKDAASFPITSTTKLRYGFEWGIRVECDKHAWDGTSHAGRKSSCP